jgi:hypothetical protein
MKLLMPFFLILACHSAICYWKFLFTEIAHGKLPSGVSISDGDGIVITSPRGTKYISTRCSNELNIDSIFSEICESFLTIDVIREELERSREFEQFINNNNTAEIQKAKFKSMRSSFVEDFILDNSKHHRLSFKNTKRALRAVKLGIHLKYITNDNILPSDDFKSVSDIRNVEFDSKLLKIKKYCV